MKISKIYSIPIELFKDIVRKNNTLSDILKSIGLHASSGNYRTLKRRLKENNIDYGHITLGIGNRIGKRPPINEQPIEQLLITSKSPSHLKRRLLKEGLLKNQCYECGQLPIWNGKHLSLQFDHINGISDDNRLENLRILCPHCHSQTITFAGKNKPQKVKIIKQRPTKIVWPSYDDLSKMIEESNYVQVGKKLGVSDNAVRKRLLQRRRESNPIDKAFGVPSAAIASPL
jgi:5-methylcytosine-specific restriction endonuclease McrA